MSTMPSNRLDVLNLQDRLDQELKDRHARPLGICPVREDLHFQCLDELIRQITIACAERGALLTRVRDELQLTITTYRNLYESAVAFGMRKALKSEQGKRMVEERYEQLEIDNGRLQDRLVAAEQAHMDLQKRSTREKDTMVQKHNEEVKFYRKSIDQLNAQVQTLVDIGRR